MQSKQMVDTPANWDDLWGIVGENLLGGVHHALNNRVAALSAISQVLGSGMPDSGPLVASLAAEVQRLEDTVALLSHLRRARSRRAEPVQVPELVSELVPLLAQYNDLREIVFVSSTDPGVLPVWTERDLLTRVLLTLMAASGLEGEWGGYRRVRIAFRGDKDWVAIRIACERDGEEGLGGDRTIQRLDARAAAGAIESMKGEFEVQPLKGESTAYEVRLPTLLAARRTPG